MGSNYLTWLPDALRNAGLVVVEYDGWQNRARSSGGFDSGKPFCVMVHHTASPSSWNGWKDADYIAEGDEDAPLANLYIDRAGIVFVIAAGATNTNGKGRSVQFSRGTVPADSMNTHAIGIEMGNDGVGETWPQAQVDAMFACVLACNAAVGNAPNDVCTHNYYAPDRKIDPATAAAVKGPWKPSSVTSSGTWDLADIETEAITRSGQPWVPPTTEPEPPIPAPEDDEDMRLYAYLSEDGTLWVGNGIQRRNVTDENEFNVLIVIGQAGGNPLMVNGNGDIVRGWSDVGTADATLLNAIGKPV